MPRRRLAAQDASVKWSFKKLVTTIKRSNPVCEVGDACIDLRPDGAFKQQHLEVLLLEGTVRSEVDARVAHFAHRVGPFDCGNQLFKGPLHGRVLRRQSSARHVACRAH